MREIDDDLSEIKREIIESRGLVIKTNNLANALSADLKSIAKRQQSYERRLSINSATAYVVFVIVVLTLLKFAWDARIDAIRSDTEQKVHEAETLREEIKAIRARDDARARGEARAAQFFELVRAERHAEVIEQYESIKKEQLSRAERAIFKDAAERARTQLSVVEYQRGLDKARAERWQDAATAFEASLKHKKDSAIAARTKLELAGAYRKLGRYGEAIPILTDLAQTSKERDVQEEALYLIAYAYMDQKSFAEAKTAWRKYLKHSPDGRHAAEARMLLNQLVQYH